MLLAIYLIYLIPAYECANILCYFNIPLYSRQGPFRALAKELASRGHQVVVLTALPQAPAQLPPNLTEIDVSTPYDDEHDLTTTIQSEVYNHKDILTKRRRTVASMMHAFEQQLQSKAIQEIIQNKTGFDLLIVDSTLNAPTLALSHILRVPAILVRTNPPTYYEHDIVQSEKHDLLYPHVVEDKFSSHSPWGVALQWYRQYEIRQTTSEGEHMANEILKRNFGPGMPSVAELKKYVHAIIVNSHWLWDHHRPVPPDMVYVGDMGEKEEKELPEDIQSYLDASMHGVIYMSFGSIFDISKLSQTKLRTFLNVFAALPYDVIVKSIDDLPGTPANVRVYKWLPQSDVLRHPKIKLFITQGGLHSTMEAITAGVPILGVPMFTDHWYNIKRCVDLKVGLEVDLETVTEEQLLNAISVIIKDHSFAAETRRLRDRLRLRDRSVERAALAAERVLRTARAQPRRARERCPELPLLLAAALALLLLVALARYLLKAAMSATEIRGLFTETKIKI